MGVSIIGLTVSHPMTSTVSGRMMIATLIPIYSGYDDLASKINSGSVGRPKRDEFGQLTGQHLGVSDVTAQNTAYVRPTANHNAKVIH